MGPPTETLALSVIPEDAEIEPDAEADAIDWRDLV
jgi:hypothetical protein